MIEKDGPIVKIILDSGKIIWISLTEAIDAGLIDADGRVIEDKQRLPRENKMRKRNRR